MITKCHTLLAGGQIGGFPGGGIFLLIDRQLCKFTFIDRAVFSRKTGAEILKTLHALLQH